MDKAALFPLHPPRLHLHSFSGRGIVAQSIDDCGDIIVRLLKWHGIHARVGEAHLSELTQCLLPLAFLLGLRLRRLPLAFGFGLGCFCSVYVSILTQSLTTVATS